MKMWIRDIIVGRDREVVEANVWEVPAVTTEDMQERWTKKKGTHKFVSALS